MKAARDGGGARIGPNAITQLAAALTECLGAAESRRLLAAAGLDRYAADPPQAMVGEAEVTALHRVLRAELPHGAREAVCRDAGRRTALYLLEHRIPRLVRALLAALPAQAASHLLLAAIRRHAWTFAGSARFSAVSGKPVGLSIEGCALCRGATLDAPACAYYAATFEGLFRALVHPQARAAETACAACGADACRFEVRW